MYPVITVFFTQLCSTFSYLIWAHETGPLAFFYEQFIMTFAIKVIIKSNCCHVVSFLWICLSAKSISVFHIVTITQKIEFVNYTGSINCDYFLFPLALSIVIRWMLRTSASTPSLIIFPRFIRESESFFSPQCLWYTANFQRLPSR